MASASSAEASSPEPGAERWLDWLPLDELDARRAPRNPKLHDVEGIAASVQRHGVVEVPAIDERTGKLVAGHGRLDTLLELRRSGADVPDGARLGEDGRWYAPVLRGWQSSDDDDAESYLVGSNQLTIAPGWDEEGLADMLKGWDADDLLGTGFSEASAKRLLDRFDADGHEASDQSERIKTTWAVIVECASEHDQARLLALLMQEGRTARALSS